MFFHKSMELNFKNMNHSILYMIHSMTHNMIHNMTHLTNNVIQKNISIINYVIMMKQPSNTQQMID